MSDWIVMKLEAAVVACGDKPGESKGGKSKCSPARSGSRAAIASRIAVLQRARQLRAQTSGPGSGERAAAGLQQGPRAPT